MGRLRALKIIYWALRTVHCGLTTVHCGLTTVHWVLCALLLPGAGRAQEPDVQRYAWEFPVVTKIQGADDLVAELREEVAAVLEAGHLAPLNCRYGDLMPSPAEVHFVYEEPGR